MTMVAVVGWRLRSLAFGIICAAALALERRQGGWRLRGSKLAIVADDVGDEVGRAGRVI